MKSNTLLIGIGIVVLIGIGAFLVLRTPASTPTTTTTTSTTETQTTPTPGVPGVTTSTTATVSNSTAIVSGNVVPNGAQTTYWFEYGTTANLGSRIPAQAVGSGFVSVGAPGFISGLSANTAYYFRLIAQNSYGTTMGEVRSFTTNSNPPPTGTAPSAHTDAATNVTRTSVNLNGRVNPDGAQTTYWFEYGTTSDLGNVTSLQSTSAGTSLVGVSAAVGGLTPATKYFYRLDAQNQFGTVVGSIQSFTTVGPAVPSAPTTDTTNATGVTSSTATLNGVVDPNGAETTYWFEYSQDSLLGSLIGSGTAQKSAGSGTDNVSVSANISGLAPNTAYYFRLVASNSQGTVRGDIVKFTTKR